MKIRKNVKLKSFKLSKIFDDIKEIKNKNNPLFQNIVTNTYNSNYYNSKNKNILSKNFETNSTEIHDNYKINISYHKNRQYILNNNNKKNDLFYINKDNRLYLYKTFDNNARSKCFSVTQTLNYYGKDNIKVNAAKAVMKMNNILLKKNINNLSLPKKPSFNISIKNKDKITKPVNDKKHINIKKLNFYLKNKNFKNFFFINLNKNNNSNKKSKHILYEKEKKKERNKYNQMLLEKFMELEACEKKFDHVIEDTLQKLNKEELNLYKQ